MKTCVNYLGAWILYICKPSEDMTTYSNHAPRFLYILRGLILSIMSAPNPRYHADEASFFRQAEHSLQRALDEGRITENDSKLIQKYTRRLKANISPGRYFKITSMLVNVRRYFNTEFSAVDEDVYLDALSAIKYATYPGGKSYSDNTKADWLKITKRLFVYLHKEGLTQVPLDIINETKTGGYDRHTKTEEDVLTADEINRIIEAAHSPKYKAYFGLLYETGARSIELANLRWQDLTFNKWGVSCNLRDAKAGVTPKIRTIPCVIYAKFLSDWRSQYPGEATGERFVFVTPSGNPIQYKSVDKALKIFAKEAGVTRHVSLHRFRHSRITHCLRQGMSETLVKKAFWGNQSTSMIATYGHLTAGDIEDEYLRMAGVEVERKEINESPKPVQCVRCFTVSPPGTRFCPVCGNPLSGQAIAKKDDAMQLLERLTQNMTDAEKLTLFSKLSE